MLSWVSGLEGFSGGSIKSNKLNFMVHLLAIHSLSPLVVVVGRQPASLSLLFKGISGRLMNVGRMNINHNYCTSFCYAPAGPPTSWVPLISVFYCLIFYDSHHSLVKFLCSKSFPFNGSLSTIFSHHLFEALCGI